jgi:hypothetical protein
VIGVVGGKLLVAVLMLIEAAIGWIYFAHLAVAGFMAAGALFFVADATLFFRGRAYPSLFAKGFFVGWNLVVVATAYLVWRTGVFMLPG